MSRDQAAEKGRVCDKEEEKSIRRNTHWYECGSNRMSWDFFFFFPFLVMGGSTARADLMSFIFENFKEIPELYQD